MAKYLQFLVAMLAIGKQSIPIFLAFIDILDAMLAKFDSPQIDREDEDDAGTLAMTEGCIDGVPITADVLEAESEVLALTAPDGSQALGDGTRLRRIFKFLQDSGLLDLLLSRVIPKTGG